MYFLPSLGMLLINSCCIFQLVPWFEYSTALLPTLTMHRPRFRCWSLPPQPVWIMSRSLYGSRKWTVVSQTHCPSFLQIAPSLEPKRENLLLVLRWMVPPSSSVSLLHLLFLFPATEVKGRRTGRSRYLCGTRSAVTGWETTSTSTCTSALRRVGTGGSTRHMKSPVTVRNRPVYFWFAESHRSAFFFLSDT